MTGGRLPVVSGAVKLDNREFGVVTLAELAGAESARDLKDPPVSGGQQSSSMEEQD